MGEMCGVEVAVAAGRTAGWPAVRRRAVGITDVTDAAPGRWRRCAARAEAGALAGAVEAAAPDLPDGVAVGAADGPAGTDPAGRGPGGVNPYEADRTPAITTTAATPAVAARSWRLRPEGRARGIERPGEAGPAERPGAVDHLRPGRTQRRG